MMTQKRELGIDEKVVRVNRVAKVVKGGRRLRFSALVVVGDGKGSVGIGKGKADEVALAIQKASASAKKNMTLVTLRGDTIPHEIQSKYGAAKVLLKPARPGTGLIAGGSARAVLEVAGIKDIHAKSLGSNNPVNLTHATMVALTSLRNPEEVVAKRKGYSVNTRNTNVVQ